MVVAFVHPNHDCRAVTVNFPQQLRSSGWIITDTPISPFPSFGDLVSGTCCLIVVVHSNTEENCCVFEIHTPPQLPTQPIAWCIWAPFNKPEFAVSCSKDDKSFNNHAVNDNGLQPLQASIPSNAQHAAGVNGVQVKYFFHCHDDNPANLVGSAVVSVNGLCPPFNPIANTNVLGHYFGIKFKHNGNTYVRTISPFEFVSCFRLTNKLSYTLSHPSNTFCLDAAIPTLTSTRIFKHVLDRCIQIHRSNFEIFEPNQYATPAACIQTFLNGAVGVRLPSPDQRAQAYLDNTKLAAIIGFVQNPGTITTKSLKAAKLSATYRAALHQSQIALEDGVLILQEPIVGSESYARLQLVPLHFCNLIFIVFHSNPLGAHLNATFTLHRIRLCFYWPGMYRYITRMCGACPGCVLTNPTRGRSCELIYTFPIEAPMMVLHVNGYQAGKESGFEGSMHYLVACCGMCTFAAMEPIANANSTTYASAIMKVILRYGFCHTIVLDKDSNFFGVCREALDLLKINCHVLSRGNHNPMLVECINRYLNQGLCIMCNERDSNCVALEAILLLIYAWNSCPVPGTDISRSMVAVGREFEFPIDFSAGKHTELYSAPGTVKSYLKELATCLDACRKIAMLLINLQQCWHRELLNSRQHDPRVYSIGDIDFARRATRSDSKRGQVDKLMHPFTGPWRIVESLPGASYAIKFVNKSSWCDKKHAADLSPYPPELIPFEPLDSANSQYGQLYKPIGKSPNKEAGIESFKPPHPFQLASHFITKGDYRDFHFPTLAELNKEVCPFPWIDDNERIKLMSRNEIEDQPALYTSPPPSRAVPSPPSAPPLGSLVARIINSSDRLFFILHSLGNPNICKWLLVGVTFSDSTSLSPSCLQDGRFLMESYTLNYTNVRFNAANQ